MKHLIAAAVLIGMQVASSQAVHAQNSAIYISGAPDSRWSNDDLGNLKTITASDFDVVAMDPVYTDANIPTGAAPTITSFTANLLSVARGKPSP
jgi:hypothetical protein